jgi:hypothetical protein
MYIYIYIYIYIQNVTRQRVTVKNLYLTVILSVVTGESVKQICANCKVQDKLLLCVDNYKDDYAKVDVTSNKFYYSYH